MFMLHLLPKWRGAAPIQRSIMNLDNQTGISIMKIVEGIRCWTSNASRQDSNK